ASQVYIRLSFPETSCRRPLRSTLKQTSSARRLEVREWVQPPPHVVRLAQFVLGRFCRYLHSPLLDEHLDRLPYFLMPEYPIFEHDVLVIGAGGAGLRAAIEASDARVTVGLICKLLVRKSQTFIAEVGMTRSMAECGV